MKMHLIFFLAALLAFPFNGHSAKMKSYSDVSRKTTVSVHQLASRYGFRSITITGKQITLQTRFNTIVLTGDSRKATFNGIDIWLNGIVTRHWGTWHILQDDIDRTILPLLNPNKALASEPFRIVALDAGHGGDDRGAHSRSGLNEKTITLELARKVRAILLQYKIDARLTRAGDQNLELDDRCRQVNAWNSSLLVSIHLNSANSSDPSGIETHIVPPAGYTGTANNSLGVYDQVAFPGNRHDRANMVLGYQLQKSLLKHTGTQASGDDDRGVRRSRFVVIKNVACPAALVECGFLSNYSDAAKLAKPEYREKIARGIAEGIMAYLNSAKRANQVNP